MSKFSYYVFETREKVAGEWFPSIWIAHASEVDDPKDVSEAHYEHILVAGFVEYPDAYDFARMAYPNTGIESAS